MTRWFAAASVAAMLAGAARAEDVTLQLKWVTQAQFAGYYVALDQGFYEEEGLSVTIKPGTTSSNSPVRSTGRMSICSCVTAP